MRKKITFYCFLLLSTFAFSQDLASMLTSTDVHCYGSCNGTLNISATGGSPPYNYSIDNGVTFQNSNIFSGLCVGDYTVLVRDAVNSQVTNSIIINEPSAVLASTAVATNVFCSNDESLITVIGSGGTPNYTYAAVIAGSPAPTLGAYINNNVLTVDTNLASNLVWDVYVRDANGCIVINVITIINDPLPTVTVPVLASNQCDLTGVPYEFTVATSKGVAPLSYSIDGVNFQSSGTFTVSTPGSYTVTVKDGHGCTAVSPTSITVYPPLDVTPTITTLPSCNDDDGEFTVTGSGGSGVYTYTILPRPGTVTDTPTGFAGVPSGTYTVTIDDGTCTDTVVVDLESATLVTFTAPPTDVSCNGSSDGVITVNLSASNDNPLYSYAITAGPMTRASQNSNIFTGLLAGSYTVEVTLGRGCSTTLSVAVGEPTLLAATAAVRTPFSCSVTNASISGEITVTAGTGTAPYEYSFNGSGYSVTNTLIVNDTGVDQTIPYSVRDANGCTFNDTIRILALNPPTDLDFLASGPITCSDLTIDVTLTATNGISLLTYEITTPAAAVTSNITGVFTGLLPETYIFRVTDANGCYYEESYTVDPVTNITVSGSLVNDVNCNGAADGAVSFTVGAFTGTYSYVFDGNPVVVGQSATTILFTGLAPGNHTIEIIDDVRGCIVTVTISVYEPVALASTAVGTNVFCGNHESIITVTASGGMSNYTYAVVMAGNPSPALGAYVSSNILVVDTNLATNLVWDVYVRDANGCIVSNTVIVNTLPELTAVIDVIASGNESSGVIEINVSGGVAPYNYSIDGGVYQAKNIFSNLSTGTYAVSVRDANGCEITNEGTIESVNVDNGIVLNGDTLTSNIEADTYQWINADTETIIEGATGKIFKAEETGRYRVQMTITIPDVTIKGNRNIKNSKVAQVISVSSPVKEVTVLGVNNKEPKILKAYPNPADNYLILPETLITKKYSIYNILGQKINSGKIINKEVSVKNLLKGVYYLNVEGQGAFKFIKK